MLTENWIRIEFLVFSKKNIINFRDKFVSTFTISSALLSSDNGVMPASILSEIMRCFQSSTQIAKSQISCFRIKQGTNCFILLDGDRASTGEGVELNSEAECCKFCAVLPQQLALNPYWYFR